MTILHVDTGREMRGGQHQVLLLLKELRRLGHSGILLARKGAPLEGRAAEEGFAVYPSDLCELWQRSRTVDLVHAHDARAHSLAAVAAQKRFVVARRVAFPVQRSFLSRLKYGRAAGYLAISHFVRQRLEQAGVPGERIDVVYDAAEPDVKVGTWHPSHPVVAPAFQNDPQKLSALTQEACRRAGLPLLLSDHLLRDLPQASVFLYLTRSEGLGSAAILALAAGVPVVASRVEGLAEVLKHERSGLYVDGEDPEPIAAALKRIVDEPELAAHFRDNGLRRVQERFSPQKMAADTLGCYERALAR